MNCKDPTLLQDNLFQTGNCSFSNWTQPCGYQVKLQDGSDTHVAGFHQQTAPHCSLKRKNKRVRYK